MFQDNWLQNHKSVCSIVLFGNSGAQVRGVTGFHIGNRILTDNDVHKLDDIKRIRIRFYEADGFTVKKEKFYNSDSFRKILSDKKNEEKYGVTFIDCGEKLLEGVPEIKICDKCDFSIGKESFSISFHNRLDIIGIFPVFITSSYKNSKGLSYLLYNGNVNPGCSGAPLLSKETGKLIGVVTSKELSISKSFDELRKKADDNLGKLDKIVGKMVVDDIDLVQVMMACQSQLKHIVREFFVNFAVKTGYALDSGHVREIIENEGDLDFEN